MKYVDSFRDPDRIRRVVAEIRDACAGPCTIMEICGGQTHTIARYAIEDLLPDAVELLHGPGCPVCVTPLEILAAAYQLAVRPGVTLCTFGDMLRIPGPNGDLLSARARGGDVRIVVSPLDAVTFARANPSRKVVFLAVGFETTAPATAMAIDLADRQGLENFSALISHVRVPPAMELLLSAPDCSIDAFLAAGHVCTVAGTAEYPAIAERHRVPIAIAGFEPLDILLGILDVIRQLASGRAEVENRYSRAVRPEGNPLAQTMVDKVFEVADTPWRGLGPVPAGGLRVRNRYAHLDAARIHGLGGQTIPEPPACRAADVLTGRLAPLECPAFGTTCTPDNPLGAPMVSTEGACAAYFRYRRGRRAG